MRSAPARGLALAMGASLLLGCPGSIGDTEPFLLARQRAEAGSDAPGSETPGGGGCPAGFSVERQIFAPRCATSGCHDALSAIGNLDLESPAQGARIRGRASAFCPGRTLANPSDPDQSLLVIKVRPAPGCGDRMPLMATALTATEIACVRQWVASLAPTTLDAATPPIDASDLDGRD